mmetsp:Transcript_16942/g.25562  ORF Transcript_16942/g.25562 Transcript_16942/m.25562 type:complete len:749 (+) Transcript_16942:52-2298(+)
MTTRKQHHEPIQSFQPNKRSKPTPSSDSFTARIDRTKAVALNKDIARYAKQKELIRAKEGFQLAVSNGWANTHTYSAAINAHVRCGDISGAQHIYNSMKNTKGIRLDVVSCTTMMKGFGSIGRMDCCQKIIDDMSKSNPKVLPNIRTINTFLRGCVYSGSVAEGEAMLHRMQHEFQVAPDISTWEYVVTLLCQGMLLDRALPIVGRLRGDKSLSSGVGAMYVNLSRAFALIGDGKNCRKSLKLAGESLNTDEEIQMAVEIGADGEQSGSESEDEDGHMGISTKEAVGGKRAWKAGEDDDARAQSLEVYREHRRAELRQEISVISKYASGAPSNAQVLVDFYCRLFSFPFLNSEENSASSLVSRPAAEKIAIVDAILSALVHKFGLVEVLRKSTGCGSGGTTVDYIIERSAGDTANSKPDGDETPSGKLKKKGKGKSKAKSKPIPGTIVPSKRTVTIPTSVADALDNMRAHLDSVFTDTGVMNFTNLFASSNKELHEEETQRPVKLEICSGAGEWAVKQALCEIDTANWITLEIRHDRVYQTLTRAVFEGASNLAVFCGDAGEILPMYVAEESLQNVFVNYPEPPQQLGGDQTQGKHILTSEFFGKVERVLSIGGKMTILTDNLWYGKLILRTLSGRVHAQCLADVPLRALNEDEGGEERVIKEEIGGYTLYQGKPGAECGHVQDASSYFDRLWKRGRQPDRYYIALQKVSRSVAAAGATLPAVGSHARRSGVGQLVAGTGKKIKFNVD